MRSAHEARAGRCEAYGGAYDVTGSKHLGAQTSTWPRRPDKSLVMRARGAANILYHRELAEADGGAKTTRKELVAVRTTRQAHPTKMRGNITL